MRPFTVAANWKMHKNPRDTRDYFAAFLPKLEASGAARDPSFRKIIFFVPALNLHAAAESLKGTHVGWGAQNAHWESKGAFTGENSPQVLAELATPYVLVGHSERRALFGETDEQTGLKVKALQALGITPMLCVGETLEEREAGKTNEVIVRQLNAGLAHRDTTKRILVAYEPVWAIGTGKVASPEQANEAHAVLRKALASLGQALADATPILYGGSVKPDNSAEIAKQPEIDGFLVGGASLESDSFLALCQTPKERG
jgi:triosephosphate isomerase